MILWNAELTKRLACSDKEKAILPSGRTGIARDIGKGQE